MLGDLTERVRNAAHDDPESGHLDADKALCEALLRTARLLGAEVQAEAEVLIGEFDAMGKWYA